MMAHDAAPVGASRSTSACGSIAFTVAKVFEAFRFSHMTHVGQSTHLRGESGLVHRRLLTLAEIKNDSFSRAVMTQTINLST